LDRLLQRPRCAGPAVHRLLIGCSSAAHRRLIGCSSAAHRRLIGCSSAAHRLLICFSSAAHLLLISCSSPSHRLLICFSLAAHRPTHEQLICSHRLLIDPHMSSPWLSCSLAHTMIGPAGDTRLLIGPYRLEGSERHAKLIIYLDVSRVSGPANFSAKLVTVGRRAVSAMPRWTHSWCTDR
jgi:hypothetical protein